MIELTNLQIIYLFVIVLLFALISIIIVFPKTANRHTRNIKKADKVILKIQQLSHPGQVFSYLRKIDPFVMEEAVLTQFEKIGYQAVRNKRYTGDGGIDGMLQNEKGTFLVQTKRYSGQIQKRHVLEFYQVINNLNAAGGYFVHTGKTSKPIMQYAKSVNIKIVSGQKLLDLLGVNFTSDKIEEKQKMF